MAYRRGTAGSVTEVRRAVRVDPARGEGGWGAGKWRRAERRCGSRHVRQLVSSSARFDTLFDDLVFLIEVSRE